MVFLRGPNYNSTKGCFAYFGVSPGKAIDKAKAFVLDYPNPSGTEQAENLWGIARSFGVAETASAVKNRARDSNRLSPNRIDWGVANHCSRARSGQH
jgi:hypothetical protein